MRDNRGFSLVELLVTISILAVLSGGMAIGINLAFSRDASQCAGKLNDAIYDARMLTMSKSGDYSLAIYVNTDGNYYYVIDDGDDTTADEEVFLSENKKIQSVTCYLDSTEYVISGGSPLRIYFDKTKGNVKKINTSVIGTGSGEVADGIITFTVTQRRGNGRTDMVKLVTATGKHTVGDFK